MKTYFLAVTFKDVQMQNVPLTSKMAKNKFNVVNQCGRKNGQICTSCFPTHLILSDSGLSTVWPSQGLSWGALTLQQLLLKMYQFPQKKEGQKLRVTAWIIGITEKMGWELTWMNDLFLKTIILVYALLSITFCGWVSHNFIMMFWVQLLLTPLA